MKLSPEARRTSEGGDTETEGLGEALRGHGARRRGGHVRAAQSPEAWGSLGGTPCPESHGKFESDMEVLPNVTPATEVGGGPRNHEALSFNSQVGGGGLGSGERREGVMAFGATWTWRLG